MQTFAETLTISPICISYVCVLTHYKGSGCSRSLHIKFFFFISPSRKCTHGKQANISFLQAPFPGLAFSRRKPSGAAARSGARPICASLHSCARSFSQRRRAGDGHLAGGDAEEQPGPVSHAWLERQQQVRGGGRWWGGGQGSIHTLHFHL